MKMIDDNMGMERAVSALLGKTAKTVTTALADRLLGTPKKAKRAKRKPASTTKATKAVASTTGEEVSHG